MVPISPASTRGTHRFCIAPMMARTDRHARFFLRLITKHSRLYTEMVAVNALLHGNHERLLQFDPAEHPIALQLGGSDPGTLVRAARIGEAWGYDEINLNVGCPSDRVANGNFGACLMANPSLVADCVGAIRNAVRVPVTVKCRIGIDDMDIYEPLDRFVAGLVDAGCETLVVHARKAWLKGLSPKENRSVPPIDYDRVYKLKRDFPELHVVINGEIRSLESAQNHLTSVDGVMMGRAAYERPYMLAKVDQCLFNDESIVPSRIELVERFIPYVEAELSFGTPLHNMTRHILGLFAGCRGARLWRRCLSSEATKPNADVSVIHRAIEFVQFEQMAA